MAVRNWKTISPEIKSVLYGDTHTTHQGHWVLLRRYDIGQYSKYWDSNAHEAIGGPKWKYKDYPLRTTFKIGTSFTSSLSGSLINDARTVVPGDTDLDSRIYIIERCFRPRMSDHILEFDCDLPEEVNDFIVMARTNHFHKYKIVSIPMAIRPDGSIIEYYLCATKLDQQRS